MTDEFRTFAVTIAAGTAQASPSSTAMSIPQDRWVEAVEFRVPPGCAGVVGFALESAHQQVVPYNAGSFIITDNESIHWDFGEPLKDGAWSLRGFNTGQFAHTIQVRFLLTLVPHQAPAFAPLHAGVLSGHV